MARTDYTEDSRTWIEGDRDEFWDRRRRRTKTVLLDHGTQIRPQSLRRRGHRVHWRKGETTRSAYLRR